MSVAAPKVSVVMAVRNGAAYLQEALDSIAAQSDRDFETIVVDDGSTDATPEILARAARQDARVRVLRQDHAGLAQSLNRGMAASGGTLIARHDADDRSGPTRFARQVEYLDAHPAVALVGAGATAIDAGGHEVQALSNPTGTAAVRQSLVSLRATPVHGAVMFRRAAVMDIGGYRSAFLATQDLDLWLRLSETWLLDNLAERLYGWRLHDEGVFATRRRSQLMYAGVAMTFAFERLMYGADSYVLLESSGGDLERFSRDYRCRGRLESWWGELLFRGLGDPAAARPHLGAALAAGRINARTVGLFGWSLLGLRWPGGTTLGASSTRA